MLPCVIAPSALAHEIPADVKINIFVRPAGDRLELLVRVPLAAMIEVEFPDARSRIPRHLTCR